MSYVPASVESLEPRRMLSSSSALVSLIMPVLSNPVLLPPVTAPAAKSTQPSAKPPASSTGSAVSTPTTSPTPVTRSTDLVGHWTGKIKATLFLFITKKVSATLDISSQTATALTGTISIDGNDFTGTFTGHINPKNGRFNYSVKDNDVSIKLSGKLNRKATAMYGDVSAKFMGFTIKGRHEFKKSA